MYNEGDIADGPNGQSLIYRGGQWVPLSAASPMIGGPITIGTPDPAAAYAAPQAAANLAKLQQQLAQDQANSPLARRKLAAETRAAEAGAVAAERKAGAAGGREVSSETRAKALEGFNAAQALRRQITEIQERYDAGPGSTSGLAGLRDYLPYTINQQFDVAGNAARAFGGPVLGFTSSQLNTEQEQQRAIGPYIPQASDRDAVILDKIKNLRGLADLAENRSTQVLGGRPDALGNIVAPTGPSPGGPAPIGMQSRVQPQMTLATGETRSELDSGASQRLESLILSGAPIDQIQAASPGGRIDPAKVDAIRKYLKSNPDYRGFAQVVREQDNGFLNRAAASPLGAAMVSSSDAVVPLRPFLDEGQSAALDRLKAENPGASLAGTLLGGVAATGSLEGLAGRALPGLSRIAASRLVDGGYGAMQGAANSDNPLTGGLSGAAAGLVGGMVGRGVTRGVGRAIRGVDAPAQQYLRAEGVPMTAGQALGGTAKQMEDAVTGYPLIGGIIGARRGEGLTGFNRAMFRQASEGAPIADIGERGAEQLDDMITQAYAPLNNVRAQADPQTIADLAAAAQRGQRIPGRADDFNFVVREQVGPNFDRQGVMSGRGYQESLRGLRREGASQGVAQHADSFRDALGGVGDALTDTFARQAPEAVETLNRGNRLYRNQAIVDQAVRAARNVRGPDGDALVMPSQLANASVAGTSRFGGKNAAATTERPFYDLARYGQEVLPSRTGDSGTAARLAVGAGLATAGGAGAGYADGGVPGAAAGGSGVLATLAALTAAGGSRTGQRAIVSALLDRPDVLRRLGGGLTDRAALGGLLGVPLGLQFQSAVTAP